MKQGFKLSLVAAFGTLALSLGAPLAHAADAAALAKSSGCMSCHSIDKKVMGPSFKEVAKKYKGNAGATALLEKKIKDGGGGAWGPIPMPANGAHVSEADIKVLTAWVLAAN